MWYSVKLDIFTLFQFIRVSASKFISAFNSDSLSWMNERNSQPEALGFILLSLKCFNISQDKGVLCVKIIKRPELTV
jgi:hypothetical protein